MHFPFWIEKLYLGLRTWLLRLVQSSKVPGPWDKSTHYYWDRMLKKARNVYHFFISFSLSLLLLMLWICRVSILSFESKCHHHGIIVSPYCRGGPLFDPRIPKIVIANPTYYCHQVMLQLMIEIMYNYNLKMVDSPGGKFIAYANDAKNSLYENHYFDDKTVMFCD